MLRWSLGIALTAVFVAGLVFATLSENAVECDVCVSFGGRNACRTVSAADRDHAVQMAVASACAVLSGGVTRGIQCTNTPPTSVRCE